MKHEPVHKPHAHLRTGVSGADTRLPKIVLVGNPNVGKSVVFNYLSGMYVDVSNFPGTTIEVAQASYLHYELYDTPGIYGISSFNDEERVARDIILNGDIVINIVDAVHLERDLFLTQQLIDMGKRVGVVVNMLDEARKQDLEINLDRLSHELGVPVAGTVATKGEGLEQVHELIVQAREGSLPNRLHSELHTMLSIVGSQSEALLVLEGDPVVAARHGVEPTPGSKREELYIDRRNRVNRIVQQVVRDVQVKRRFSAIAGRATVSPLYGIPILLLILYILYQFVGVFVAGDVVDYTENTIGKRIVEFHIKAFIAQHSDVAINIDILDEDETVVDSREFHFSNGTDGNRALWSEAERYAERGIADHTFTFHNPLLIVLFGEFGAVTMTFTYLVFLLLPLVLGFYFSLSILEDSGYLPRLATLVDRLLRFIGLNGRAIIPLILGFGCVTVATITTRLLNTQREKTIATAILQLAIPCSAQLGVIAALLATAGIEATLIYTSIIFTFLVAVGTILNKRLPGEASPLLLDLPPLRIPRIDNILKKTGYKTWFFMKEASPWFFIGALVVSVMQVTGALDVVQHALRPLVEGWLKLPAEASTAFVMGLVRRDFGAAGLYTMELSRFQIVAALTTITLFVPCIASLMVMFKERGIREGLTIWIGSLILALLVGGLTAQALV